VSSDPTPRTTLMLDLMALDSSPSAYIGRPCYFALARSPGCSPGEWTSRRYSAEVVASLEHVIRRLLAEGRYEHVVLFGHSGGGTLATLLASRMPEVDGLVTLAANLDVAGWAALHGYTPLHGSLDPAALRRVPRGIFQVHWLGSEDDDVPPSLFAAVRPLLGDGEVRVRHGFDHACCWKEIWPTQLTEIATHLADAGSPSASISAAAHLTGFKENLR
jgi:pimeloyl-ACP methyl ester carboxylesterase